MIRDLTATVRGLFYSYSELLFLQSGWAGAVLLAITLIRPHLGVAGLTSVAAAFLFSRSLGLGGRVLQGGFYTYNPLLVGLSVGTLFRITPLTLFFAASCGIIAYILTYILSHAGDYFFKLPVLSLPFVLVSTILTLAAQRYSNLYVTALAPAPFDLPDLLFPDFLGGYLKSLGAVFFSPHIEVGLVLLLILAFHSRILLLLTVVGYVVGATTTGLLTGSFTDAFRASTVFNHVLTAMALGGVFLVPSLRSLALASLAVVLSSILTQALGVFWVSWGIPLFTTPFNLTVLPFLYFLGLAAYPGLARILRRTPEEAVCYAAADKARFRHRLRPLALPFLGRWTVYQAFDGPWTHRGNHRHAYDFIITDEAGNHHRGSGALLEDWYAFGKPVIAPVRGRIAKVVSDRPDNAVGKPDRRHNWGNAVVIYDERGFYVEISHFAKDSITVKEGDWVEVGAPLGKCGNSGFSGEPHIHMQVQGIEVLGAYTLPFCFAAWKDGDRLGTWGLPETGARIESVKVDPILTGALSLPLDSPMTWVRNHGRETTDVQVVARLAADGSRLLESGESRLNHLVEQGTLLSYSLEGSPRSFPGHFFLALARVPLAPGPGATWHDHVPAHLAVGKVRGAVASFLGVFFPPVARASVHYQRAENGDCVGQVQGPLWAKPIATRVSLDEAGALACIRVGATTWTRKVDSSD